MRGISKMKEICKRKGTVYFLVLLNAFIANKNTNDKWLLHDTDVLHEKLKYTFH